MLWANFLPQGTHHIPASSSCGQNIQLRNVCSSKARGRSGRPRGRSRHLSFYGSHRSCFCHPRTCLTFVPKIPVGVDREQNTPAPFVGGQPHVRGWSQNIALIAQYILMKVAPRRVLMSLLVWRCLQFSVMFIVNYDVPPVLSYPPSSMGVVQNVFPKSTGER